MNAQALFTFFNAIILFSIQIKGQLYRRTNFGGLNYRQYAQMNGGYNLPLSRYQPHYRAAQLGHNSRPSRPPAQASGLNSGSRGYADYLRQLNQGFYPQRRQNSVYQFSPHKTGFPLGAHVSGYQPNHSPLPLSAPGLYGYGGYQTDRWGQWSGWSQCSRSCDGGVQERTRNCLSAKLSMTLSLYRGQDHNQRNCPGFGKEFQPCNTKPCVSVKSFEDQKYDARKAQCGRFNNKEYLGQRYVWLPYIREGLSECRLYCMAKGFRMFVELANRVDEGTPCGKAGNEACYNGICSRTKPRKEPIRPKVENQHHFNQQHQPAVSRFQFGHRAPIGLNLGDKVLSTNPQGSYVPLGQRLLQKVRSQYPSTRGRFQLNAPRHQPYQGAGLQNQRRPLQNSNIRALQGHRQYAHRRFDASRQKTDAKTAKVFTKVISGHYNTKEGLKLGYNPIFKIPVGASNVQVKEARPSPNFLALKVGDKYLVNGRWSIALKKDVKAAGTTIRYRLGKGPGSTETITADGPTTKELQIVLLYQQGPPEVSFNYTLAVRESPKERVFKAAAVSAQQGTGNNIRGKARPTLHWSVAGWTTCSKPCGGGEQRLNIRCVAVYPGKRTTVVRSSYCHTLKKPPQKRRMCNLHACKPRWVLLPWKPCSKTCGEGAFQTREVRCVRVALSKRGKVEVNAPFYECGPRPAIRKSCPFVTCYKWNSDPWSQCSRSCDNGVQTRKSYCVAGNTIVEEALCDKGRRPERVKVCNLRPCKASWFIGQWNECNKVCGQSVEKRLVFCAGKDGSALTESFCETQIKPETTRVCETKKCDGVWFTSNWTQCSSECGAGEQTRLVLCLGMKTGKMSQVPENNCNSKLKPASKKACDAGPCNPKWFATEWSHCSRTCGRGIRTRQLNCMLKNGQVGRGCQAETRPNSAMICQVKECENEVGEEKKDQHETMISTAKPVLTNAKKSTSDYMNHDNMTKEPKLENGTSKSSEDGKEKGDFAAAETVIALPVTRKFKIRSLQKIDHPTTIPAGAIKMTTHKTTQRTTQRSTLLSTTVPATTKEQPADICNDSFKQAYCSVILRIGFCKFTTYRKRCCRSCEIASIHRS